MRIVHKANCMHLWENLAFSYWLKLYLSLNQKMNKLEMTLFVSRASLQRSLVEAYRSVNLCHLPLEDARELLPLDLP